MLTGLPGAPLSVPGFVCLGYVPLTSTPPDDGVDIAGYRDRDRRRKRRKRRQEEDMMAVLLTLLASEDEVL